MLPVDFARNRFIICDFARRRDAKVDEGSDGKRIEYPLRNDVNRKTWPGAPQLAIINKP